jgi:tripartite-type tricarboxylate transporter receptor subunit TctC
MPATHVPYKSSVAAQTDLMAGQIQMMVDNFSTMAPNVQSGRVRALAITGSHRSPLLPEVPTFAELGIPIADAVAWGGIVGPAKLPAEVVSKLNSEINKVLADPKVQKQLANTASDVMPMSAVDFTRYIKAQDAKWAAVIKNANITAD